MTAIRVVDRQQRRLAGVGEDADDHRVEDARGPLDDVEVAVGDRVERAGVDRDAHASSIASTPRADRRSAPSRRSGARAPMLAARRVAGGASRQKCLATTRPPGARSGAEGLERVASSERRVRRRAGRRRRGRRRARRLRAGSRSQARASARTTVDLPAPPRPVRARLARDDPGGAGVALDERRRGRRPATGPRCRPRRCPRTGRGTARRGRSGSRIANRVCLTRSASGRVPGPGASSRMRPAVPAMTRPASATGRVSAHEPLAGSAATSRRSQPDRQLARRAARGRAGPGPARPSSSSSRSACARARTASSRWSGRRQRRDAQAAAGRSGRSPSTSPSRRSSKSRSASSNPSVQLGDRP